MSKGKETWSKIGLIIMLILFLISKYSQEDILCLSVGVAIGVLLFIGFFVVWKELIMPAINKLINNKLKRKESEDNEEE